MIDRNNSQLTVFDSREREPTQPSAPVNTARNPYASVLNPCLRDAVNQATLGSPAEQVMLYAELALMREASKQAVKLWSDAMSLPDEFVSQSGQTKQQLIGHAGMLMQGQLEAVAVMSGRCAQIESVSAEKFSVHNLHLVVAQISDIAERVLSKLPAEIGRALSLEFQQAVQTHVRLESESRRRGTDLLPHQTVLDMDSTIPHSGV